MIPYFSLLGLDSSRGNPAKEGRNGLRVAAWLEMEAALMSEEGRTARDVAARLKELKEVIADWEEGLVANLPEGDPWMWSRTHLDEYVEQRRAEW